jgi:hypothetical protein
MTILKTVLACVGTTILSLNAMAVTPKGEAKIEATKTTDAVATPTEAKSQTGDTYYWFDVTSDGSALSDPSGIPLSQGQSATGECTGSQPEFCQRGYTSTQTSISGGKRVINVPVESSSAENHREN